MLAGDADRPSRSGHGLQMRRLDVDGARRDARTSASRRRRVSRLSARGS